jgi:ABC-2 type transport system ATP-binding protein
VDAFIHKLSKGFRQRVGIAQAIIHEPDVLILDEPTVGIDPIQINMTRELIRDLGKERTIILSTHILPEVNAICERVIIIHEGRILAQDSIENLSSLLSGSKHLRLEIEGEPDEIVGELKKVRGISNITHEDSFYHMMCPVDSDPRTDITETINRCGLKLLSMASVTMSLEDIFLKLTKDREKRH